MDGKSIEERLDDAAEALRTQYGSWVSYAVTAMTHAAAEIRRLR